MQIVYLAGPYRGQTHYDIELNIREAEYVAIKLWQAGYAVICPHKNTAHFDGKRQKNQRSKTDTVMKIIYPENKDQAKALMQFLVNEMYRHQEDIDNISGDVAQLSASWDLSIPEPNHTFMKVR